MAELRFNQHNSEVKGWLYKWTNYLKGYQKRWFVLSNGLLSYYRNPAEVTQSCRGTISLVSAVIHTEDSCNFVISNGGTQTFHLRANNEIERQNWVTALELAKVRAIRQIDSEDDDDYDINNDKKELQAAVKLLATKLDTVQQCHDVVIKHGSALQRSLIELEQTDNPNDAITRCKTVNERATLFRITSSAMINANTEYLNLAQSHGKKWQKLLQHEHQARLRLEELVEQLAKQHSHLEQKAIQRVGASNSPNVNNSDDDEDEFYDAEDITADFIVNFPGKAHRVTSNDSKKFSNISFRKTSSSSSYDAVHDPDVSSGSEDTENSLESSAGVITRKKSKDKSLVLKGLEFGLNNVDSIITTRLSDDQNSTPSTPVSTPVSTHGRRDTFDQENTTSTRMKRTRRTKIPDKPNHSLNLWSIMKNCIGKELTKIPMPVNFNEPLSMLQRLTEDFEYADLLHKAARIKDPCEQLTYVAAFSVTSYATTSNRVGKPFNPLLGETYECDRTDDLGWKCVSEQVSHHPPMLAQHCQGKGWTCWREFAMASKFRGKYLQITPIDITHLEFQSTGYHMTWKKVTTTVHNIIVGKLWVDNHGDMTITNHTTGDKCHLKFIPYSYFSRDVPRKVTGVVVDKDGTPKWVLQGTWNNKMEAAKVINSHNGTNKGKPILETATPKIVWKRNYPPSEYERMYNMTILAVQLNEIEEGVPPTDSRYRPDQRLMEEGKWDEANTVKSLLEEKQRATRRKREEEAERAAAEGRPYVTYEPVWFSKQKDPITGNPVHTFNYDYWNCKEKQDWSKCPDIFL